MYCQATDTCKNIYLKSQVPNWSFIFEDSAAAVSILLYYSIHYVEKAITYVMYYVMLWYSAF